MASRRSPSTPTTGGAGTTPRARQARRVAASSAGQGKQVASRALDESQRVASTARGEGESVARVAAGNAKEVGGTVREQALQVREEVTAQGRAVVGEARTKLQAETGVQARRAADGVSRLADEIRALADGRPDEAPTVAQYVNEGADRLIDLAERIAGLADELEVKGIDGVVSDVTRFARRRPGTFLLGAAVAGFGVGRLVRSAGDDDGDLPDDEELAPTTRRVSSRRALPSAGTTAAASRKASR